MIPSVAYFLQTWYGAYSKPGAIHVVDTEVINAGVPYSDNFYVINRYCITRVAKGRTRLRITSQIKYRKNVWGLVKSKYLRVSLSCTVVAGSKTCPSTRAFRVPIECGSSIICSVHV